MTTLAIIAIAIAIAIATQGLTVLAVGAAGGMILTGMAIMDVPAWRAAWAAIGVTD